jgi:hypothetical protein
VLIGDGDTVGSVDGLDLFDEIVTDRGEVSALQELFRIDVSFGECLAGNDSIALLDIRNSVRIGSVLLLFQIIGDGEDM